MIVKKEKTAPNVSVGADTEQSIQKCTDISINDNDENIKDLDESFREMQREMLITICLMKLLKDIIPSRQEPTAR